MRRIAILMCFVLLVSLSALVLPLRTGKADAIMPCSGLVEKANVLCSPTTNNCAILDPGPDPLPGHDGECTGIIYDGQLVTICDSPAPPNQSANCVQTTTLTNCALKFPCTWFDNVLTGLQDCRRGAALLPSKTYTVTTPNVECIVVQPGSTGDPAN